MVADMHKFIAKFVDELSNKYGAKKDLLDVVVALLLLRRIYSMSGNTPIPVKRNDFINIMLEDLSGSCSALGHIYPELKELGIDKLLNNNKRPELLEIADSLLYLHQRCQEDLVEYIPNEVDAAIFDLLFAKSWHVKDKQCLNMPRQIIKLMVALAEPGITGSVLDATFNSGYFLVETFERIQYALLSNEKSVKKDDDGFPSVPNTAENIRLFNSQSDLSLKGVEQDEERYHLGILNLVIRELTNRNYTKVDFFDYFSRRDELFDVVLANPPFGSQKNRYSQFSPGLEIETRNLDILFLNQILHLLKHEARACVIVPESNLTKTTSDYIRFRQLLLEKYSLEAVISLPAGAFSPTTNAKASILVISRTGSTARTWFYDLESVGYSLDRNRRRTKGMPLQDCLERFIKRKETPSDDNQNSGFFVDAATIRENNWVLAVKRYKKPVYTPIDAGDPQVLLDELTHEQREIDENLNALKELLR